jgi:hypothetical protein
LIECIGIPAQIACRQVRDDTQAAFELSQEEIGMRQPAARDLRFVISVTKMAPILEREIWPAGPLIGRVFSNPDQFLERVFKKHLAAVAQRFRDAIAQVLPGLPLEEIVWRLHFMAGSMSHVLVFSQVLPAMTGGLCRTEDRNALMARLVTFLSAGFRAPASSLEEN